MGGHSEKKNQIARQKWSKYLLIAIGSINAFYIGSLVLALAVGDEGVASLDSWDLYGWLAFSGVSYFCYNMITGSVGSGLKPEYTLDIFIINLTSQLICSFTRYGWYLYLLIPLYITYIVGGWIWGYLSRSTAPEPPEAQGKPGAKGAAGKMKKK